MQAITTKYLGATDSRGSRIKATCEAGSITISYPHEFSGIDCHAVAAKALMVKMGWTGEIIGGGTQTGYVFVFADSQRYTLSEEQAIEAAAVDAARWAAYRARWAAEDAAAEALK